MEKQSNELPNMEDYRSLSKEELLSRLYRANQEKEVLISLLKEKELEINSLNSKVEALEDNVCSLQSELSVLKMKTSGYLSYLSDKSISLNFDMDSKEFINQLEKEKQDAVSMNNSYALEIDHLMARLDSLEKRVEKRNSTVQNYRELINSQEEAMNSLCHIVNRLIDTIPCDSITDDQELLIAEFKLLYSRDDDNSDVENVLVYDDSLDSSSNCMLSPRLIIPTTPISSTSSSEVVKHRFSFISYLGYISNTLSSLSFDDDDETTEMVAVQVRSELSLLVNRISMILQNGPCIKEWLPDCVYSSCPDCCIAFGTYCRKHHCRWCGRVICARCSTHRITWSLIGQNKRVCDKCYLLYLTLSPAISV